MAYQLPSIPLNGAWWHPFLSPFSSRPWCRYSHPSPITTIVHQHLASSQLFFANRVRIFSGHLLIPLIAGVAAILHLVAGLALVVYLQRSETISGFFTKFRWLSTLQFALSMAIDIINTASLCFYLSRRRTGIKRLVVLSVYAYRTHLATPGHNGWWIN